MLGNKELLIEIDFHSIKKKHCKSTARFVTNIETHTGLEQHEGK